MFDLIVRGGMVIDGTGAPAWRADVGVLAGRVEAVGDLSHGQAAATLDAANQVVAPGFIDCHSHSDLRLLTHPTADEKLRQGVTTEVLGQDGLTLAPLHPERGVLLQQYTQPLTGPFTEPWTWTSFAEYMARLEAGGIAVNAACFAGHNTVRIHAMGFERRRPTVEELETMAALIRDAMESGALGMSSGLIYLPGTYSETPELTRLCQVVAEYRGVHTSHIRSESHHILEALDEMRTIARDSGAWVNISHMKIAGRDNWSKLEQVLAIVEDCARQGWGGSADQYPYTAGNTMMAALLPPWVLEGGVEGLLARIAAPQVREQIRTDISTGLTGWDAMAPAAGWENVIIGSMTGPENMAYEGWSLAALAADQGKDPVDTLCDLLLAEGGAGTILVFHQSDQVVEAFMRYGGTSVCTDGIFTDGKPHPRLYGSFPRVLGHFVRERGVLTLQEAIRRMTSLAADNLGLSGIGRLQRGYWADMTVFDPEHVGDQTTYSEPRNQPIGISHVVVSGQPVLVDGVHTGALPGRVLRRG